MKKIILICIIIFILIGMFNYYHIIEDEWSVTAINVESNQKTPMTLKIKIYPNMKFLGNNYVKLITDGKSIEGFIMERERMGDIIKGILIEFGEKGNDKYIGNIEINRKTNKVKIELKDLKLIVEN